MVGSSWSESTLLGLICGLIHVIGPDHLGTLMTLSTVASDGVAFRVGGAWGLAHSVGMILVCLLFIFIQKLAPKLTMETWSYYGDYFIGFSMIFCAIYFMIREGAYIEQQRDGTFIPVACACHSGISSVPRHRRSKSKFCSYGADNCVAIRPGRSGEFKNESDINNESVALMPPPVPFGSISEASSKVKQPSFEQTRGFKEALLGLFQGLCCPMGLVGVSFVLDLASAFRVLCFLAAFIVVSSLGTALLAVAWARVTRAGCASAVSPRLVYRGSCAFTMALGVVWILANACGVLAFVDYTEGLHHHDAGTASGAMVKAHHEIHGHEAALLRSRTGLKAV